MCIYVYIIQRMLVVLLCMLLLVTMAHEELAHAHGVAGLLHLGEIYIYIYIYIHPCICNCVYIYMYIYIYIYIYMYTHVYIYTYTHIYTYVYIYIYMYMFTCPPSQRNWTPGPRGRAKHCGLSFQSRNRVVG